MERKVQRGDVVAGAVVAAGRVDDDDGAAGQQDPRNAATWAGRLRSMMPTCAAGPTVRHPAGRRTDLAPGQPRTVELQRRRGGIQSEHVRDAR